MKAFHYHFTKPVKSLLCFEKEKKITMVIEREDVKENVKGIVI